jgi:DNA-directed RNA polymerase specialized sigma24 family protein
LITREIPRLRRYARALAGDVDKADDLVQDCLERALRKRHLRPRYGSLRAWLISCSEASAFSACSTIRRTNALESSDLSISANMRFNVLRVRLLADTFA